MTALLGFPQPTRPGTTVPQSRARYLDARLPIEVRLSDLLGRMTLEEKIGQMLCLRSSSARIITADGTFDTSRAVPWFRTGVGRMERPSDGHGARTHAEYTNAIQQWVKANTRLGIPILFHEEALHGLRARDATSFPQSIALASTWNPELIERVFAVTAAETRARGSHQVLAPVIDIARDPRWGRIEETFGEDPWLTARMGVAAVHGFQGRERTIGSTRVIATLKHMTGHGQPESGINIGPASLGERTLRDMFLVPFEAAIREANAQSVMPSYNEVDGLPSHANPWMLRDVLRGEWKFDGVIVSDWNAIRELITRHRLAGSREEAARLAVDATVDIELPDIDTYDTLVEQVKSGAVPMSAIDRAVRRLLRAKFVLGLFENPLVDPDHAEQFSGSADHRPLALEAARQAITLLKNDRGTLPLQAERLSRVAVIGPHAGEMMLGSYSGTPRFGVSILEGIRTRLGSSAAVDYAEGVRITEDSTFTRDPQPHMSGTRSHARSGANLVVLADSASNARRIEEAVVLARRSEVAIIVVGDNEQTAREGFAEAHLGDRATLGLPGQQEALVHAVVATGTPVVLVLIHGRPASIPAIVASVPAILDGWYLGQEGGTAMAEALFGDINPGGKLPLTVARHVGQLPLFYNHKPSALRGYLFESTAPLFPFGHGLSYTTFKYSNLRVMPDRIRSDAKATVSVDVTNTGARPGDEVVQLYISDAVSRASRPVMELRGFSRVPLAAGETRTVTFEIGPQHLAYHDHEMQRVVEPGRFEVMVGGSSVSVNKASLDVEAAPRGRR
ncbi:MAG: glycoside hydrolase family 3 N-terminal domain-containing protein [Gemmatimonadaceae bacterium]